jgi:hypothetical protein
MYSPIILDILSGAVLILRGPIKHAPLDNRYGVEESRTALLNNRVLLRRRSLICQSGCVCNWFCSSADSAVDSLILGNVQKQD